MAAVTKNARVAHEDLWSLTHVLKGAPGREQSSDRKRVIVTCMKNEGPFVLEWLSHHLAIGFDGFLIYTNDCTDGTDDLLALLQARGLVQHRRNPYREAGKKPQTAAFRAAEREEIVRNAHWLACVDVDEFVNIKCGGGTLDDLFSAVPDASVISMTWRLFGNNDRARYADRFVTEQFLRCAPEYARRPHQAWGFKTLFRNNGTFQRLGIHRPKAFDPGAAARVSWVNGSGKPMPRSFLQKGWRSTPGTYGYDLVQLNHYAVRSADSFLVKRDRGRVNHVDRDQGPAYWFRMNNNADEDTSILRRVPATRDVYDDLMRDPEIRTAHARCVAQHRDNIGRLKSDPHMAAFVETLTNPRAARLSRLHARFGTNVFLAGPSVVPASITDKDPYTAWFFTVPRPRETRD